MLASEELRPYQADALNSVQGDPDAPVRALPSADSEANIIKIKIIEQDNAVAHQRRLLMLMA